MQIKNVLLLGGSGFVGAHIAHQLTQAGVNVTIPTRRRERAKALITLAGADVVEADIHDEAVLADLMAGQDAVINLVGILHDHDSRLPYGKGFARAHVELPRQVVAAMQRAGVRRLLHMSALKADPAGPSEYLRSKGEGEAAVMAARDVIDVTVFRPSVIFGLGDSFLTLFAALLRKLPFFPLGGGDARFQPVHVEDVAAVFAAALEAPEAFGQAYDLCGPKVYTLRELVAYTGRMIGKPRPIVDLPEGLAYLQAGLLWLLPDPPMSPDNLRSLEVDSICGGGCRLPFGVASTALEAVAPTYLAERTPRARYNFLRFRAGR